MFFQQFNKKLQGNPDHVITALLLIVAVIAVIAALWAPPVIKATIAAWFIAP